MSKLQKLQFQLSLAIILLFSVLISGIFIFSPISIRQVVNAVTTGDYTTPTDGTPLTYQAWNMLDEDFVHQDSGTATDLTVDNITITNSCSGAGCGGGGGGITDTSGSDLKMICGRTPDDEWQDTSTDDVIYLVVTTNAGFTNADYITTSLAGKSKLYGNFGASDIYRFDENSFGIYIFGFGNSEIIDAQWAIDNEWYINWCVAGR